MTKEDNEKNAERQKKLIFIAQTVSLNFITYVSGRYDITNSAV